MVETVCPKCQKVFTHPKYISLATQKLDRHLNRKNACDGSTGVYKCERTATDSPPDMNNLDLTGVIESLDGNIRFVYVASHIFNVLNTRNKFATMPNVKLNEIYYTLDGEVKCSTPKEFVFVFWYYVMVKQVGPMLKERWERYQKYSNALVDGPMWSIEREVTQLAYINVFLRSEFYKKIKSGIVGHLKTMPRGERTQMRVNMGVKIPEERQIFYLHPEIKCSIKGCQKFVKEKSVCEVHLKMIT